MPIIGGSRGGGGLRWLQPPPSQLSKIKIKESNRTKQKNLCVHALIRVSANIFLSKCSSSAPLWKISGSAPNPCLRNTRTFWSGPQLWVRWSRGWYPRLWAENTSKGYLNWQVLIFFSFPYENWKDLTDANRICFRMLRVISSRIALWKWAHEHILVILKTLIPMLPGEQTSSCSRYGLKLWETVALGLWPRALLFPGLLPIPADNGLTVPLKAMI